MIQQNDNRDRSKEIREKIWQKGKKIGEISEDKLKKLPEWKKGEDMNEEWEEIEYEIRRYTHDRSESGYNDILGSCGEPCFQCKKDKKFKDIIKSLISSLLEKEADKWEEACKHYYEEGRKAKGSSWREGYTQGREEVKKEIVGEILEKLPNEQSHWLEHGDGSGHPHDTEYDFGWNSAIKKVREIINKLNSNSNFGDGI